MADITFKVKVDNTNKCKEEVKARIEEALEVCGGTIESYAKNLCPVGTPESTGIPDYKGGSLRSTIRHEVDKNTVYIGAGGIDGIFKFVNYSVYVELGTRKMSAQPYLKPAIVNHLTEYKRIIERAFRR